MKDFIYTPQSEFVKKFPKTTRHIWGTVEVDGKEYIAFDPEDSGVYLHIIPKETWIVNPKTEPMNLNLALKPHGECEVASIGAIKTFNDKFDVVELRGENIQFCIQKKYFDKFGGTSATYRIDRRFRCWIYHEDNLVGLVLGVRPIQKGN